MRFGATNLRGDGGFVVLAALIRLGLGALVLSFATPVVDSFYRKGADAFAVSDARRAQVAMLAYATDHQGFGGATAEALREIEPQLPGEGRLWVRATGTRYTVQVVSNRRGVEQAIFSVTGDHSGATTRECRDGVLNESGLCHAGSW